MKDVWNGIKNLFDKKSSNPTQDKPIAVASLIGNNNYANSALPLEDTKPTKYINESVSFDKILWKNDNSTILPKIAEFGKNFTDYIKQTIDNNILSSESKCADESNWVDVAQQQNKLMGMANNTELTGVSRKRKRIEISDDDYPQQLQPYEKSILKLLKCSPSTNSKNLKIKRHQYTKMKNQSNSKPIEGLTNFSLSNQREMYNFGKNRPQCSYGLPSAYVARYNDKNLEENESIDEIPVSFETIRQIKKRYKIGKNKISRNDDSSDSSDSYRKLDHDECNYVRVGKVHYKRKKPDQQKCCHKSMQRRRLEQPPTCERCHHHKVNVKPNKKSCTTTTTKSTMAEAVEPKEKQTNKSKLVEFSIQIGESMLESPEKNTSMNVSLNASTNAKTQILNKSIQAPDDKKIAELSMFDHNKINENTNPKLNILPLSQNNISFSSLANDIKMPISATNNKVELSLNKPLNLNLNSNSMNNISLPSATNDKPGETAISDSSNKQPLHDVKISNPPLSAVTQDKVGLDLGTNASDNKGSNTTFNFGLNTVTSVTTILSDNLTQADELTKTQPLISLTGVKSSSPIQSVSSDESTTKSSITLPLTSTIATSQDNNKSSNSITPLSPWKINSESNNAFDQHNLFKSTDSNEAPSNKPIFNFCQNNTKSDTTTVSTSTFSNPNVNVGLLSNNLEKSNETTSNEDKLNDANKTFDKSSSSKFGSDSNSLSNNVTPCIKTPSLMAETDANKNKDLSVNDTNKDTSSMSLENKLFGNFFSGFESKPFSANSPLSIAGSGFGQNFNNVANLNNSQTGFSFGSSNQNPSFTVPSVSATSPLTGNNNISFNTSAFNTVDPNVPAGSVQTSSFGNAPKLNTNLPSFGSNSNSFGVGFGSASTNMSATPITTEKTGFNFDSIPNQFNTNTNNQPKFGFGLSNNPITKGFGASNNLSTLGSLNNNITTLGSPNNLSTLGSLNNNITLGSSNNLSTLGSFNNTPPLGSSNSFPALGSLANNQPNFGFGSTNIDNTISKPFSFQPVDTKTELSFNFSSAQPTFSESPRISERPSSASGGTGFSFVNPTASAPMFSSSSEPSDSSAIAFMRKRALKHKRNR